MNQYADDPGDVFKHLILAQLLRDLPDDTIPDSRTSLAFVAEAVGRGAIVEAWYPLYSRQTPATIENLFQSLDHALMFEVRWAPGSPPSFLGAGVIVANAGSEAAGKVISLVAGLEPIYGSADVTERH